MLSTSLAHARTGTERAFHWNYGEDGFSHDDAACSTVRIDPHNHQPPLPPPPPPPCVRAATTTTPSQSWYAKHQKGNR